VRFGPVRCIPVQHTEKQGKTGRRCQRINQRFPPRPDLQANPQARMRRVPPAKPPKNRQRSVGFPPFSGFFHDFPASRWWQAKDYLRPGAAVPRRCRHRAGQPARDCRGQRVPWLTIPPIRPRRVHGHSEGHHAKARISAHWLSSS
jgi:hypothetical protein